MAVTYINGVAFDNHTSDQTVMGVGSAVLGGFNTTRFTAADHTIHGVDAALGGFGTPVNRGIRSDRAPNAPSGMTLNGVPTYGSGKKNTVTVINEDESYASANARFTYFVPLVPVEKKFRELT